MTKHDKKNGDSSKVIQLLDSLPSIRVVRRMQRGESGCGQAAGKNETSLLCQYKSASNHAARSSDTGQSLPRKSAPVKISPA